MAEKNPSVRFSHLLEHLPNIQAYHLYIFAERGGDSLLCADLPEVPKVSFKSNQVRYQVCGCEASFRLDPEYRGDGLTMTQHSGYCLVNIPTIKCEGSHQLLSASFLDLTNTLCLIAGPVDESEPALPTQPELGERSRQPHINNVHLVFAWHAILCCLSLPTPSDHNCRHLPSLYHSSI